MAAGFVLRKIASAQIVVEVLSEMIRSAERAARTHKSYRNMVTELMRFRNLQYLLPDKHKRAACISYYESIKNLDSCKRNPLFWFQYAISCLLFEDFDRSKTYFDTAYSLAKSTNFDTYQIDNHYARFHLLAAIRSGDSSKCMKSFRKARRIINRQIQDERFHYPYRVATNYAEFFDQFENDLKTSEKEEIGRAAKFISRKIQQLPEIRRKKRRVSECKDAMAYILELVFPNSRHDEK